ncbi:MAG: hypothetical protein WA005_15880 [Candidatus Binataceae bacterium]
MAKEKQSKREMACSESESINPTAPPDTIAAALKRITDKYKLNRADSIAVIIDHCINNRNSG